jgi:hypothetical protein
VELLTYDPQEDLAERYPHIRVKRWPLVGGARSALVPSRNLILVHDELEPPAVASSLTHEGVHLDWGDRCSLGCTVLDAKREHAVDREAAERQIPWDRLLVVLQVDQDEHQHADELGVDVETLQVRMRHLTDAQRAEIERLFNERNEGVA